MKTLLVYGTLRQDEYNYDRVRGAFGPNSLKKVGETEVHGYRMHNLGFYPAVVKATESDKIVCDVMEASDKALAFIDAMEKGAGYDTAQVQGHTLYFVTRDVSGSPVITSGNWKKRNGNV